MFKTFLLLVFCASIFATGECGVLSTLFHRKTTTEQPEEVTTIATPAATSPASPQFPANYFKSNNVPSVEKGCKIVFTCKKTLKRAETPKPCVKYCVKKIDCENGPSMKGTADQCLELNEDVVAEEYNDCKKNVDNNEIGDSTTVHIAPVAMIDFPCQPGYLPDSRGRCREVW